MSKVIVIPDIHGRDFWKIAKDKIDEVDRVVFLGDYFDPYRYEFPKLTNEELYQSTYKNAEEIIQFKKDNMDKVILLYGNHDWAYLNEDYRASRFDREHYIDIHNLFGDNSSLFTNAHIEDSFLFTHAGLSEEWLGLYKYDNILEYLNGDVEIPVLMMCGRFRGGYDVVSGPMWQDYREFKLYAHPYKEYKLIFGHTQLDKTGDYVHEDNWWCIDSRACFLLDTETDKIILI